jgi:hypothetical protein
MYKDQKFRRGDLVRHENGAEVIILYSYADVYGSKNGNGRDIHNFSVIQTKNGSEVAWYSASKMTLIEHVGEDKIREIKDKFDK